MRNLWCLVLLVVALGCDSDDPTGTNDMIAASNVVYVLSNNTASNQNAVIAYRRTASTGALTQFGTYLTGGTGHANPTANRLGPNDLDDPLVVAADKKRLFAVNSGSNTVAVFNIATDGALTAVTGSPFPSGGRNPVALGIAGSRLYVVNKNEDPAQLPNADAPNYTGFTIGTDGSLAAIPGSTVSTLPMVSPSQALISRDGKLLFGADFLAAMKQPGTGSLRSFTINTDGTLASSPGSPQALPGDPMTALPLGLWMHPSMNLLYVGFPARMQMGVYDINPTSGELGFVTAVASSGMATCWIRQTTDGKWIYTVNSGDNSMSFFDATNPRAPVERQKLVLKNPGPLFTNEMGMQQPTSQPFQEAIAPDGKHLYVIAQRVDFNSPYQGGNQLHILSIASDGMLSEPLEPIALPVPPQLRPHGVVVL
jgi:6-phosphogluconolactonase (cycloisomerase 2 family)